MKTVKKVRYDEAFFQACLRTNSQKRALLEKLLQQESLEEPAPLPQLARRQGDAVLPCRLLSSGCGSWISGNPRAPPIASPGLFPSVGSLRLAALEHSFNELVRRHEALRTTFVLHNSTRCK